jgi:hypothetical protein
MENPEAYKASKLPVITSTVLSLLPDLSPATRARLLDDQTPEELIMYCKQKFDEEFDLHFEALGAAGASEVAWHEVFYDFSDDNG